MPPLTLPRPGLPFSPRPPIPAPSESSFTATFGTHLPPARYLQTPHGKAAYYLFPASSPSPHPEATATTTANAGPGPKKVLLIHGVQTPALGLFPLINALRGRYPGTEFATLDLWGHGLSETPWEVCERGLFAGLVGGVVEALGWSGSSSSTTSADATTSTTSTTASTTADKADGLAIIGYSFGAVVSMTYLTQSTPLPKIHSLTLIAPAGLLRHSWFPPSTLSLLQPSCAPASEPDATSFVLATLEGQPPPIVVPSDWRERVNRGEVVAQAIKAWQMENHAGHAASVVGVFRDGGVMENDGLFVETRALGMPALVVLGEKDGLSTEEEIAGFGFDVKVVPGAGHAVVRENVDEVAEHISAFWQGL